MVKRASIALAAAVVIGFGVYVYACLARMREPEEFTQAFDPVTVGMRAEQVDSMFGALSPRERFKNNLYPGDQQKYSAPSNATSSLMFRTWNNWQYRFFLDTEERVVDKQKWWD